MPQFKRKRTFRRRAGGYGGGYKRRRTTRRYGTRRRMAAGPRRGYGTRIKTEIKSLDIPSLLPVQNNSGRFADDANHDSVIFMTNIKEGAGFNNRIGRKINLKSIRLNGYIAANSSFLRTTTVYPVVFPRQTLRMLVVYDKQFNGAAGVTLSDVLQDVDLNGTATTNGLSSMNLDNRERYKIVWDKKIVVPSASVAAEDDPVIYGDEALELKGNGIEDGGMLIDYYKKLGGLEVLYKANTGGPADVTTGALFCILITDASTSSTIPNPYYAHFLTRIRYYDV